MLTNTSTENSKCAFIFWIFFFVNRLLYRCKIYAVTPSPCIFPSTTDAVQIGPTSYNSGQIAPSTFLRLNGKSLRARGAFVRVSSLGVVSLVPPCFLYVAFFACAALSAFFLLLLIMTLARKLPTTVLPSRIRITGMRMAQTRGGKRDWSGWSSSTKGCNREHVSTHIP